MSRRSPPTHEYVERVMATIRPGTSLSGPSQSGGGDPASVAHQHQLFIRWVVEASREHSRLVPSIGPVWDRTNSPGRTGREHLFRVDFPPTERAHRPGPSSSTRSGRGVGDRW